MIRYLGSKTIGALNVALAGAIPVLSSAAAYLATLKAQFVQQIAANVELQATLPNPAELLRQLFALVEALLAQIESLLAGALTALVSVNTTISADLAAVAALALALETLVATITAALSSGGVHAYSYEGIVGNLAGELGGQIGAGLPGGAGPTGSARALILITESPATWSALSSVLLTG